MNPTSVPLREQLQQLLGERFEVGAEIGSGGFGQVFEVFDRSLETTVAAKVLRPGVVGQGEATKRFQREIRLLAQLSHPNITPILDVFRSEQLIAYLMPLVTGPTLRQRLDSGGALSLEEAVRILEEIGGALDFAHRQDVIHRDLKPENILLSDGHAVLADFGIARTLVGDDAGGLTETGVVVGSPRYMSPEQVSGDFRLDGRSDLYALAAIGYEMIAGRSAFAADSTESLLRQKLLATPTSLQIVRTSVPPTLDRAILRGLLANPADRQATVAEFVRECVVAPATAATPVVRAQPRKRRAWLAVAGVVAIAGVLFAAWALRQRNASTAALPAGRRAWFVIADVEVSPSDATTAAAVRSILESSFEQSQVLGVLTRDEVAGVLRSAGKPANTPITSALAREIAVRANAEGVLEASVRRTDDGGVFALRAVDVVRDSIVLSISRPLDRRATMLTAAERSATRLARELAPHAPAMASWKTLGSTEATTIVTTDLRAFELWRRGMKANARADQPEATSLMRQALARDSTFGWAWSGLGMAFMNSGCRDSAMLAFERALRHAEQFTTEAAWSVEANLASVSNDHQASLRNLRRYAEKFPDSPQIATNLAWSLWELGRNREAIALDQQALQGTTANPDFVRQNLAAAWIALGEIDSAETATHAIKNARIREVLVLVLADIRGDGNDIELAAQRLLASPDQLPSNRNSAHASIAARMANRGQVGDAWHRLEDAAAEAARRNEAFLMHISYWRQALMVLAYSTMPTPMPAVPARNNSLDSRISAGIEALLNHEPDRARDIATELEQRYSAKPLMIENAPALLRAWAASLEGRPDEVVHQARIVLAGTTQTSSFLLRKPVARWLIARAFEDLGQADSAAFHDRAALVRTDLDAWELPTARLIEVPVREHLIRMELRNGRSAAARSERDLLAHRVDRPDAIASRGLAEVDLVLGMSPGGETAAGR